MHETVIPNANPNLKAAVLWYDESDDQVGIEHRIIFAWHVTNDALDILPVTSYRPMSDEWVCLLDSSDGRVEYGEVVYETLDEAIETCLMHGRLQREAQS